MRKTDQTLVHSHIIRPIDQLIACEQLQCIALSKNDLRSIFKCSFLLICISFFPIFLFSNDNLQLWLKSIGQMAEKSEVISSTPDWKILLRKKKFSRHEFKELLFLFENPLYIYTHTHTYIYIYIYIYIYVCVCVCVCV